MGSLRIQYSENGLFVYTGYMQREFVIDKEKQQAWDVQSVQTMPAVYVSVKSRNIRERKSFKYCKPCCQG